MTPDPRWLEILKASGAQATALALATGIFAWLLRDGLWAAQPDWVFPSALFVALVSGFLALAAFFNVVYKFCPLHLWIAHSFKKLQERRAAERYIPFMTERERRIIAYLLHHNQKMFNAASDGGYANTLISRRIVVRALIPGQVFSADMVPMAIPDKVWDVLVRHKDEFPYKPERGNHGGEVHPWREPWGG